MAKTVNNTEEQLEGTTLEQQEQTPPEGAASEQQSQTPPEGITLEQQEQTPPERTASDQQTQTPLEEKQNQSPPEEKEDEQQVKIVVLKRFRDKNDHKTWYEAGKEVEFDINRANSCVKRGLAKFKK